MIRRIMVYHVGNKAINGYPKKRLMEGALRKAAELLLDFMKAPVIEVGNSLDIRITQLARRHGIREGQVTHMNILDSKGLRELLDSGVLDGKRILLVLISEEVERR